MTDSLPDTNTRNALKRYFTYSLQSPDVFPSIINAYFEDNALLKELKLIKNNIDNIDDKNYKEFLIDALHNNEVLIELMKNGVENEKDIINLIERLKCFYESLNKELKKISIISINHLTDKNNSKIFFINLDKMDHTFWETLFDKFISLKSFSGSFVFYYLSDCEYSENLENWKRNNEYHRESFGHSRFIRDYLKARSLSFEVPIYYTNETENDWAKVNYQIRALLSRNIKTNPKIEFDNLKEKMTKSISIIFPNLKIEDIFSNPNFIIHLYKYNKNSFENEYGLSTTNFFQNEIGSLNNPSNSHENLREIEQLFSNLFDKSSKFEKETLEKIPIYIFHDSLRKVLSSFFNAIIHYRKLEKAVFLFIDDNPKYLSSKIQILKIWFENPEIYLANASKLEKYNEQFRNLNDSVNLDLFKYNGKEQGEVQYSSISFNEIYLEEGQLFIFIDLDFNGILSGFDFLYNLNYYLKHFSSLYKNVYPIVLSRYEDPYFIRKAINLGAVYYINKSRFYRVIFKLFQLEPSTLEFTSNNFSSWNILNKLDPSLILDLKNKEINGEEVDIKKPIDGEKKYCDNYKWIEGLPKADLHTHIGTVIRSEVLPYTSLLVLYDLFENKKIDSFSIKQIIEFLIPIAFDPSLKESEPLNLNGNDPINKISIVYKTTFLQNKDKGKFKKSIFQIINEEFKLIENGYIPEQVLLNPKDTILERLVPSEKLNAEYFNRKNNLRKNKLIDYDKIVLLFIYLINFIENPKHEGISEELSEYFKTVEKIDASIIIDNKDRIKRFHKLLNSFVKCISKRVYCINEENIKELENQSKNKYILKFLQSARSKERCLNSKGSLFNYLRGCEYGGAPHLQSKLSIYYICQYIVNKYAIPENIRYLSLRCAVDGYSKFGLQSQEEALEALLRGLDYYSAQASKKVHVDIIITAKRHKSVKEFDNNVNLALQYRNGLAIELPDYTQKSYFSSKSKVVSFDLAGNEKGNRISKFLPQFNPLIKESFPVTVHAGEEDSYESIWEAIYLVNSHRIGHALSLGDNKNLLNMVRDRHIAVELCPISNYLTRDVKYECNRNKIKNALKNEQKGTGVQTSIYPLRKYFDSKIDVTINVDNPSVSGSTLTEEYLFAAQMSGGLSRWEILKLVKNGFKNISIDKFEKEKLMREIEDEIYQYLTK